MGLVDLNIPDVGSLLKSFVGDIFSRHGYVLQ